MLYCKDTGTGVRVMSKRDQQIAQRALDEAESRVVKVQS